jgi:hypothetical protein
MGFFTSTLRINGDKTMTNWQTYLKSDAIDWLLEKSNPSVRYLTMVNLLEKKKTDAEIEIALGFLNKSPMNAMYAARAE